MGSSLHADDDIPDLDALGLSMETAHCFHLREKGGSNMKEHMADWRIHALAFVLTVIAEFIGTKNSVSGLCPSHCFRCCMY